jgi:hypothetical protein
MTDARKKAEELAKKFVDDFTSDDSLWHHITANIIADTLTPLLEEIEAARAMRDQFRGEFFEVNSVKAYDALRKRNEKV